MKKNFLLYLFGALALLVSNITFSQSLIAKADRTSIAKNDTFALTLQTTGQAQNHHIPDLSVLRKDFTILGSAQSKQISIINNQMTTQYSWIITLMPNRAGKLIIPIIHMGSLTSNPIAIQVTNNPPSSHQPYQQHNQPLNIFLEASVYPNEPYVESQALYKLKIYFATNIANGSLTPPFANNATIKPFGRDLRYQTNYRGRRYQVIEKNFLISPQKSGEITITPAVLNGLAPINHARPNPYDTFFNVYREPFHIKGQTIILPVHPKPKTMNKRWWLPAQNVTTSEQWQPNHADYKVGQPITRSITIRAIGAVAEQLPQLSPTTINNMNIYPDDKPILKTQIKGNDIVGERTEKIVYIPTQAGTVTFPPIQLHWWNTQTHHSEITTLTQKTFSIMPANPSNIPQNQNRAQIQAAQPQPISTQPAPEQNGFFHQGWIAISFILLLLWLTTLIIWRLHISNKNNKATTPEKSTELNNEQYKASLKSVYSAIKKACDQNNPQQAKNHIIYWATLLWNNPSLRSLGEIAHQIESLEMQNALNELNQVIYAPQKNEWNGESFWNIFRKYQGNTKKNNTKKSDNNLPDLYLS